MAATLSRTNTDRQKLTEIIVKEALTQNVDQSKKLLFFIKDDWPVGLLGLVASRLVREFSQPCIVMSRQANKIVGSGRSRSDFHLTNALTQVKDLLLRYGGHAQAAGFAMTSSNLPDFQSRIELYAREKMSEFESVAEIAIETSLNLADINWDLMENLEKFQPFGMANPEPIFSSSQVKIKNTRKVGADNKHYKLDLEQSGRTLPAIAFNQTQLDLAPGQLIDIAYNINVNTWNGHQDIQLNILDIKI
jgi:single-stranded-DNA-specific exonuclease